MRLLVVDSSVIVKWLHQKNEQNLAQANKIIEHSQSGNVKLLAPELAKYEVGNALLFSKKLTLDEASILFSSLYSLPIQFIAQSEETANETYKIAREGNITYYDASFVALAKKEKAILVTDNPKHQAKQLDVKVLPLKDYNV